MGKCGINLLFQKRYGNKYHDNNDNNLRLRCRKLHIAYCRKLRVEVIVAIEESSI